MDDYGEDKDRQEDGDREGKMITMRATTRKTPATAGRGGHQEGGL